MHIQWWHKKSCSCRRLRRRQRRMETLCTDVPCWELSWDPTTRCSTLQTSHLTSTATIPLSLSSAYNSIVTNYVTSLHTLALWRPLLPYGWGTAIKHPVPDRVKSSFVIFDIPALWRSVLSVRVPGCQKLRMTTSGHQRAKKRFTVVSRMVTFPGWSLSRKDVSRVVIFPDEAISYD